jgi:hypothetical protein
MKRYLVCLILAVPLNVLCGAPAVASQTEAIQNLLNTSNDYLELVREYWPKISLGDSLAMAVSYDALNNCWHFKDEIAQAESVDDLDELLSSRHPQDLKFAKGIYYKCRTLVHHYAEFLGWQDLRLRAALSGDIRSKVTISLDFYRLRDERPRELLPFSPGEFLIEAMRSGDSMVFTAIGTLGVSYGLRLDTSPTTSVAWQLVSCKLRGNCGHPSSMKVFCAFMTPECTKWKNAYEYLEHQAGGDEAYAIANRKAEDIYAKVQQQRFEELDLDLVW